MALFSAAMARDYCIIGAGPSGLQMGHFLERAGRDYIIFERDNSPGWFYKIYPRHRNLISINKRFTGKTNKEFNLRHDWNSLISDDDSLLMTKYSKEFFPPADTMVQYLKDFAQKLNLKLQYDTYIIKVSKNKDGSFTLKDKKKEIYNCKHLIVSTGIWVENVPSSLNGVENTVGYPNMSLNLEDYEGKTVMILGRGNSGFETATHLLPATNLIHMLSRTRLKTSWQTHYVGDLRAVNCGPIDTYQLKSLDGQLEGDLSGFSFEKYKGKIYVRYKTESQGVSIKDGTFGTDNIATRTGYDTVIRALGFIFDRSIFDKDIRPKDAESHKKYPEIKGNYEFTSTSGMYLTGAAAHSLDFRKSAGGFIHGFRYTTRTLFRYLEWKNHGVEWPHVKMHIKDIMNYLIKRLNEASDIYQMFSHLVDVIVFRENDMCEYFQAVNIKMLSEFEAHTGRPFKRGIVINLEYGKNFSGPANDPFHEERATGEAQEAHTSNFLHPVLYYYENGIPPLEGPNTLARPIRIHHMVEDFLTEWAAPLSHVLPLRWFLEYASGRDLRKFYAETCFKYAMTGTSSPVFCEEGYLKGNGLPKYQEAAWTLGASAPVTA